MTELSSTAQAAGFPSIRNAESHTLALPNTFQVPAATPPSFIRVEQTSSTVADADPSVTCH